MHATSHKLKNSLEWLAHQQQVRSKPCQVVLLPVSHQEVGRCLHTYKQQRRQGEECSDDFHKTTIASRSQYSTGLIIK